MKIKINWSIIIFLILFCFEGAFRYSKITGVSILALDSLIVGVICAIGIFLSVFMHEFFHYLSAKKIGLEVDNLTIHLFGGHIKADLNKIEKPNNYLLLSSSGLVANILIVIILWLIFISTPLSLITFSLLVIAKINLLIFIFNILPLFPLDGWQVLCGVLWKIKNNRKKAERIAHLIAFPTAFIISIVFVFIFYNVVLIIFIIFSGFLSFLSILETIEKRF